MSSKTTNFNLHKIDLTDAPPDITVLNQNWDTIDLELLHRLPTTGGKLTGTVVIERTQSDGTVVTTNLYPTAYALESEYVTSLIHSRDGEEKAQLLFNEHGILLRDLATGENHLLYGTHNKPTADDVGALPSDGGTMSGTIEFRKVDNGYGRLAKNHGTDIDYGMYLTDLDNAGNIVKFIVSGKENALYFVPNDNTGPYKVYTAYNPPSASAITAGTLNGQVKANQTATSALGTSQVRNIRAGTSDMTAGTSTLTTGEIYFVYE